MNEDELHHLGERFKRNWVQVTGTAYENVLPDRRCMMAALYIQEQYGGKIYGGEMITLDGSKIHHLWNILPDGQKVDLTYDQFGQGTAYPDPPDTREYTREELLAFPGSAEIGDAARNMPNAADMYGKLKRVLS